MITLAKTERDAVRRRIRNIRSSWSPSQRVQRALDGERRRREFARLVISPDSDVEVWAVGATSESDMARLRR